MLNTTPDQLIGKHVLDFVPLDSREAMAERMKSAGLERYETAAILPDGGRGYVEVISRPLTPENRSLRVVAVRDIADRKNTERELQQERDFVNAVLDTADALVVVVDRQGRIVRFNRACEQASGYEQEEVKTRRFWEIFTPPEHLAEVKEAFDRISSGETPARYVNMVMTREGGSLLVEWSTTSLRDRHGNVEFVIAIGIDITERLKAQRALQESETRFRQAFENTPLGMGLVGLDGRLLKVNQAIHGILRYEEGELLQSSVFELGHPDDVKEEQEAKSRMEAAGRDDESKDSFSMEKRYMRGDGTEMWGHLSISLIRDAEGKPLHYIGQLEDITERKQAEQTLRETSEKLQALVESSPLAIVAMTADGLVTMWNPAAERILGYSAAEVMDGGKILGKDLPHVPEDKLEEFSEFRVRIANGESVHGLRTTRIRRDGSLADVNLSIAPLFGPEGEVTGGVAFMEDISEYKRVREEQARLVTVVEQAEEAIVFTDTAGSILYVNPAFEQISGYPRDELLGRNPSILKSGKHPASLYRELWETITGGGVWRGRMINKRKDGSLFEEEAVISAVRDTEGAVSGYVAIKHDVSQRIILEEQLRHSQKMEAVGRLAGGIAHDFNNILTVILGNAQILLSYQPGDATARERLETIQQAGQHAAELTRKLLAFGRKEIVEPKSLDVNEVLTGMQMMFERVIGEDVRLETKLGGGLGRIFIDPGQIEQVLMNLVVNARDAMPEGGTIELETEAVIRQEPSPEGQSGLKPGPCVRLRVTDSGHGMSPETLGHLFEPFYTTKPRGSGLGLSTVYGILTQNRGAIDVESEIGAGTTFTIHLPVTDRTAEREAPDESVDEGLTGTETILLVEDEESVRTLTREYLEELGYTVYDQPGPKAAIDFVREHDADINLLLTDVVMPEGGGGPLAQQIRKQRQGIGILFMSGYAGDAIENQQLLEADYNLITKPFSLDSLAQKIREILDGQDG
jgi:PAS domain S-box-containing protein